MKREKKNLLPVEELKLLAQYANPGGFRKRKILVYKTSEAVINEVKVVRNKFNLAGGRGFAEFMYLLFCRNNYHFSMGKIVNFNFVLD